MSVQQAEAKKVKKVEVKKYTLMKEKFLLLLLLRQFFNNRKKTPQKQYS